MSAPCPVYGFTVVIVPHAGVAAEAINAMLEELHLVLDAHGLATTAAPRALVLVVTREGSQATDADGEFLRDWAERWNDVAEVRVSELVDLSA